MDIVHSLFVQSCLTSPEDEELVTEKDWETLLSHLINNGIATENDIFKLENIWDEYRNGYMRNPTSNSINVRKNQPLSFPTFMNDFVGNPAFTSSEKENVTVSIKRLEGHISSLAKMAQHILDTGDRAMIRLVMKLVRDLIVKIKKSKELIKEACDEQQAEFYAKISLKRADPKKNSADANSESEDKQYPHQFQEKNISGIEKLCQASKISGILRITDFSGRVRSNALVLRNQFGHAYHLTKKNKNGCHEAILASTRDGILVEAVRKNRNKKRDTGSDHSPTETGAFGLHVSSKYVLNCHTAHRELIQSRYFPKWMGSYFESRIGEFWYCYEYHSATNLVSLLQIKGKLEETRPFAKHLANELLFALCDLNDQSTFSITEAIREDSVFLLENGTRIMLGNIAWGDNFVPVHGHVDNDDSILNWYKERETMLRKSYGQIISNTLRADDDNGNKELVEFSLEDCQKGCIEVEVGSRFRIDCAEKKDCDGDYRWICKTVDSSSLLKPGKKELEFEATRVGRCDILLLKCDSWETSEKFERDLAYEELYCTLNIVQSQRQKAVVNGLSATMQALVSACLSQTTSHWHLQLNQLKQFKYFETTNTLSAVAEDYRLLTKIPK